MKRFHWIANVSRILSSASPHRSLFLFYFIISAGDPGPTVWLIGCDRQLLWWSSLMISYFSLVLLMKTWSDRSSVLITGQQLPTNAWREKYLLRVVTAESPDSDTSYLYLSRKWESFPLWLLESFWRLLLLWPVRAWPIMSQSTFVTWKKQPFRPL